MRIRLLVLVAVSIITLGDEVWAQSGAGSPTWRPMIMGKNGMVAAEHPLQALAGLRVLQNGGNAVDAAVAVFYMTSVTEPSEAGLGGDGFILAKASCRGFKDGERAWRAWESDILAYIEQSERWSKTQTRQVTH